MTKVSKVATARSEPVNEDPLAVRTASMEARAQAIKEAGGLEPAIDAGTLPETVETTLTEAMVLGLLRQGVRTYFAIFGHGSTDLGEVLRIYDGAGVTRTFNFRNEIAMAHAATTLKWQYGETPAVVTSIGPGALQAFAGSLAAASNGVGVYHIYGDETTHGEGYNMQQIPKRAQHLYGQLTALMGESYVLHTPEALRDALRRGALCVNHPYKAAPFYLLLPLNTQPQALNLSLAALPALPRITLAGASDHETLAEAVDLIGRFQRIVIKAGGGARFFAEEIRDLAETIGAAVVLSPGSLGVLPDSHDQNMHVGGSKGSISGNYAMENGDLAIVIGSRAVCQADCSGVGYPSAAAVININADLGDLTHYNRTVALAGDIGGTIRNLIAALSDAGGVDLAARKNWLESCHAKKEEWRRFKTDRYAVPPLDDDAWGRPVLSQPVAIKTVCDFAESVGAVKYFDAGDVQANGFQIVEDDAPFRTFTETGASYMGYAPSALTASAFAARPEYGIAFCGDGSFMMNPQVLIDAVAAGARGMVVIFDNRRMAAISGLQDAQYGCDFRTNDGVAVDYAALASAVSGVKALFGGEDVATLRSALAEAHRHDGLSVVHVPVYHGPDPRGGMGAYGSWNVGNWCADVQTRYREQKI